MSPLCMNYPFKKLPETDDHTAAKILWHLKSDILKRWRASVRKNIGPARLLSKPLLIDTMPAFLDSLVELLKKTPEQHPDCDSNSIGQEHGGERARLTSYNVEQVIQEYHILNQVIADTLRRYNALSISEQFVIQKCFEKSIRDAVMSYVFVQGRIREQFVLTLTHDLRNPLGAALLSSELIGKNLNSEMDEETTGQIKKQVGMIMENLRRIDRMVRDLLDTNALVMGERLHLKLSSGDALAISKAAITNFSDGHQQNIVLNGISTSVVWDHDLIRRALENLISNALKYGKAGPPITIKMEQISERVAISVHNEGDPIPFEDQELLFQVFRRSESAKTSGKSGWGIGLAFVRAAAESHGGSIVVMSSETNGTTFTIDIPADATPFQNAPIVP